MIYLLTVLDADANFIILYAIVADCKSISEFIRNRCIKDDSRGVDTTAKTKMKKHAFDQKSMVWSIRLQSVESR